MEVAVGNQSSRSGPGQGPVAGVPGRSQSSLDAQPEKPPTSRRSGPEAPGADRSGSAAQAETSRGVSSRSGPASSRSKKSRKPSGSGPRVHQDQPVEAGLGVRADRPHERLDLRADGEQIPDGPLVDVTRRGLEVHRIRQLTHDLPTGHGPPAGLQRRLHRRLLVAGPGHPPAAGVCPRTTGIRRTRAVG